MRCTEINGGISEKNPICWLFETRNCVKNPNFWAVLFKILHLSNVKVHCKMLSFFRCSLRLFLRNVQELTIFRIL